MSGSSEVGLCGVTCATAGEIARGRDVVETWFDHACGVLTIRILLLIYRTLIDPLKERSL